jgi:hypothetical protein
MAITKEMIVDRIEVLENGCVQVRTKTSIKEDGKEISSTFHRHVVAPGDDYAAQADRVKAICAATHTADVISAYEASLAIPE